MTTRKVGVWTTNKLYNNKGWDAANNVATYLEGAGDRLVYEDVYAYVKSAKIYAPTEEHDEGFETAAPCYPHDQTWYNNLAEWFAEETACNNLDTEPDANILMTNDTGTNGGVTYGSNHAVAATGQRPADADPQYQNHAPIGSDEDAIHTALHEVGHMLMGTVSDDDGDNRGHHDVGVVYQYSGGDAVTAMNSTSPLHKYISASYGGNECDVDYDVSDIQEVEMTWSGCCATHW